MGSNDQKTRQTPPYTSSKHHKSSRTAGRSHKSHRKSTESTSTSSSSSSSSHDYRHHPSGSHYSRHNEAAISTDANAYYQQQPQYITGGNAGTYGAFCSYAGSYYGGEAGYEKSGDIYQQRRQGRIRREQIRLPDQPGAVRQVRHRLPTPEPDILERVYIRRQPNEVVEEIIEEPTTPPPRVQERTVVEPAGPPQVVRKVIRVPARSQGYQYQQQQTLNQYGSASGVNAPAAGGGAYGAGYGQTGQGYSSNINYYNSSSSIASQQQGQQGYGQTGYERYQGTQQLAAGAQFGYNAPHAQGLANTGMYPPQPVAPPPGIPQNAFCFETGGPAAPAPLPSQPFLPSYGQSPQSYGGFAGAANFGAQHFGLGGAVPSFGAGSGLGVAGLGAGANFGAAPSFGGIGGFPSSGFGGGALGFSGGFGGGFPNSIGSYGASANLGGASFGAQGLGGYGAQINPFAGSFSGGAMAGFGGCGGGIGGGLGGYGAPLGGFGGGGFGGLSPFGGGASFGGGLPFGGGSFGGGLPFGGGSFGGGSFGCMNPCLPAPPPPIIHQVPCPVPVPVPVPQPQPCPVPVPVPVPQVQYCPVPVPVRECIPVP